jgi:hypothetical protein
MISNTSTAKQVRKYFLEMEKLIKKYNEIIQEKLNEELGLIKKNQKPTTKQKKGGVIYIIEAQNTNATLYKIGKSNDLKKRLKTYNTGLANDVDVLFELYVDDKDKVEQCVKSALKDFQYRKYKEVYEIDIEVIKKIIVKCDDFNESLKFIFEKNKKITSKNIKRIKSAKNKIFMVITK